MAQQPPTSQAQTSRITTAVAVSSGLTTTTINVPAALSLSGSTPALATAAGIGSAVPMLARMNQNNSNNNNFGQYYLRFLRHHSTRASPVTVSHSLFLMEMRVPLNYYFSMDTY